MKSSTVIFRITFILLFLFVVFESSHAFQIFDSTLAKKFQRTIDSISAADGIQGVSAAIAIPGQGIWQGTSGYSHNGVRMSNDMLLGIGSNTKLFTSTLMLKLAEAGLVSLDNSLYKYLPSYRYVDSMITIRQLLNQTTGLFDYVNSSRSASDSMIANLDRIWSPDEIIKTFLGPPHFAPGTQWEYSNTNYLLAGMIIRNVTQSKMSTQLRQRILDPLKLDNTWFPPEDTMIGTLAHPWYNGADGYTIFGRTSYPPAITSMAYSAGAIFSTAANMAQWYQMLFSGQLLTQNSLEQMVLQCVPIYQDLQYGLGIFRTVLYGHPLYYHGGSIQGYRSLMYYDSVGRSSFAILTNQDIKDPTNTMNKLLDDYFHSFQLPEISPLQGKIYAASYDTRFFTVDTATGKSTLVGMFGQPQITRLRFDPKTLHLLGLATGITGINGTSGYVLVRVNSAGTDFYPIVRLQGTQFLGMAIDTNGDIYVGNLSGDIFTVNISTGELKKKYSTGLANLTGLAFNPQTGKLWAIANSNNIYKIDPTSGVPTLVGSTTATGFDNLRDIVFDDRGRLFGINTNSNAQTSQLIYIDTSNCKGTMIGSMNMTYASTIAIAPNSRSVGIHDLASNNQPRGLELYQNYPNPFNPNTKISFFVARTEHAKLSVYNLLGQQIKVLFDETAIGQKNYEVNFDASKFSTGIYLYKLQTATRTDVRRMMMIK